MPPDENEPMDRRRFFRHGLRELFKPLARAVEPMEQVIRQIGAMDDEAAAAAAHAAARRQTQPAVTPATFDPLAPVLRPPGALPESAYRDTCSRCGTCVSVCPAACIVIDPTGLRGNGVPYVAPDTAACVLCDGTPCMTECPSGALVPTAIPDIDMGTAAWHAEACLRSTGGDCQICVDVCPIGEMAIKLDGRTVQVIADGCTGCGLCQNRCPTTPKSITVTPRLPLTIAPPGTPRPRPRG